MTSNHDEILRSTRAALIAFGSGANAFAASLCTCDEPECAYRQPETYPVHVLLQDVARAAADHDSPPDEEPEAAASLRSRLVALGEQFQLFRCPCSDPDCPTLGAPSAPLAQLAYTTFLQWYALSGCL